MPIRVEAGVRGDETDVGGEPDMRLGLIAACIIIPVIATVYAADDNIDLLSDTDYSLGYSLRMEQAVRGEGLFNVYQNISTERTNLKSTGHGTGSYDYEALTDAHQNYVYDTRTDTYKNSKDQSIQLQESVSITQGRVPFGVGRWVISPYIVSPISESTTARKKGGDVVMSARFAYGRWLAKDLSSDVYLKQTTIDAGEYDFTSTNEWRVNLSLDADFEGRANIQAQTFSKNSASSQIFIDEDYVGAYSISKRMGMEAGCGGYIYDNPWLPCCSGGWSSMSNPSQGGGFGESTRGIFDCTCFKAAGGL